MSRTRVISCLSLCLYDIRELTSDLTSDLYSVPACLSVASTTTTSSTPLSLNLLAAEIPAMPAPSTRTLQLSSASSSSSPAKFTSSQAWLSLVQIHQDCALIGRDPSRLCSDWLNLDVAYSIETQLKAPNFLPFAVS